VASHHASARLLRASPLLMLTPASFGLVVVCAIPALYTLALALTRSSLGQPLAAWNGLGNFQSLLLQPEFAQTLLRTVLYALPASFIQLSLGLLIALLLQALRQGQLVRSLVLLPLMTPPVLVGVAWKLLLAPAGGLVNGTLLRLGWLSEPVSLLGSDTWALPALMLADTWQWLPFVVILCFAALQTLPADVFEAAALDGAGTRGIFLKITLPLLAPALLGIFLLRVVMSLKTFDLVYILTAGGPGRATTLASYEVWKTGLQNFDIGAAAAQTLLFSCTVAAVTWPILKALQWVERRTG
jgi:multiple sugar transport system permease protein